jgi:hypothetical protein
MATFKELQEQLANCEQQLRTLRDTESQRSNLGASDEKRIKDRIDEIKRIMRAMH